jgi:hypothetical protein
VGEGDLRFEASELGAEAVVEAVAERQRPHVGAVDVEAVGIGEARRIAIAGAEDQHDLLAAAQPAAV